MRISLIIWSEWGNPIMKKTVQYANDFCKYHSINIVNTSQKDMASSTNKVRVFTPIYFSPSESPLNFIIEKTEKESASHFLIVDERVFLKKYESDIETLIQSFDNNTVHTGYGVFKNSVMVLNTKIFHKVGLFDGEFPDRYFQIADYLYRMRLSGINVNRDERLNPTTIGDPVTMLNELFLDDPTAKSVEGWDDMTNFVSLKRYNKKWGGLPQNETFKTPFNK